MNTPQKTDSEQIEGLGKDEDASLGDYPIDTLLIRHESRTVFDVLRRIEKNTFVMDPDFQRDFIWSEDQQSKLIESVLMRIPLPVFYLAEDAQGRMLVVDGLQRFSTFQRFVNNELQLKLPHQSALNKKRFKELSPKLQNRVEDCNLILYVIDAKVPERARLDIFERVNGGEPLTRQQMRNCLYMGQATRFLKTAASAEIFIQATGNSLQTKSMQDREFVNRFCAFMLLPIDDYRGDMDDFLADGLKKMNQLVTGDLAALSNRLNLSLTNNFHVFEKHAFRRHTEGQNGRGVLNASLWDVMSTGLSRYPEHVVEVRAPALRQAFYLLMDDDEFVKAIALGTSATKKVKLRFEKATAMFKGVFDDFTD